MARMLIIYQHRKGLVLIMKSKIIALIAVFILIFSVNTFAAPASVNGSDAGNITGMVIVKKPETAVSSTTKKVYTVSAVSLNGVDISLYKFNPETGLFDILTDSAGQQCTIKVGATGIYVNDIQLDPNTNYLLLRAQYGNYYQTIRFDITLLNQGIIDGIKGFSTNFQSAFGGW